MTTPDPLHLPATIPGLLRRGSPVARGNGRGTVTHLSEHGWVIVHDDPMLYDHDDPGFSAGSGDVRHCGWALDLHDATGRHHALLWLAGRATTTLRHRAEWTCWPWGWDLCGFGEGEHWRSVTYLHPERHGNWSGTQVPTLADLDPTSDERLPDGSRLVDALALARVVAHVAGVRHG